MISGDNAFMQLERRLEEARQARRIRMLTDVDAYGLRKGDVVSAPEQTGDHAVDHDRQEQWRAQVLQLVIRQRVAAVER